VRVRDTLIFRDTQGNELCKIQERKLRVKDSMEIEGPDGQRVAMVKKAIITPVRDRWTVKIKNGPDLDVQGNILDHEYRIGEGRDKVAEVSKKWFRVRDSYGVEIDEGQDDILVLAATVCIDMMAPETQSSEEKNLLWTYSAKPSVSINSSNSSIKAKTPSTKGSSRRPTAT
jgi:uncharacterized protein YxjI